MKCLVCGTTMKTRRENVPYDEVGLPGVTLVNVDVSRCAGCGEHEVAIPRIEELHRVLAMAIIEKRTRLTPVEIRFLRKYLGWSGQDFARHMGVTPVTVSRWESTARPKPMGPVADRLLRMLIARLAPVEDYPTENLAEVADEEAPAVRIGLRTGKKGWLAEARS